ncbi:phenylethanolamine N-methyltransferase-like isoform X2 [Eleginops maclovinus]|uniref:phenylethanolamine N-methyltransferase-like isoform X2 n=1 Tax=Eleginops maclovinus TaxID=56733 RepID=UPI0030804B0F
MAACYQGFDPAAYLQYNYTPPRADFDRKDSIVPWKLACLHRAFTEDFLEVNRQELRGWLDNEGGCNLDWTPYLQHVCKLEGRRPSAWTEKAAKLRQVITDIVPVDVHRPQPLALDALPSEGADCLVSCFCLESVSPDLAAFTRALGHIGRLLRTGGHLLLIGALGESYYFGGPGVRIPVVPLNEAQVCASLKESGYTLIRLEVYTLPQDMRVGVDDVSGVFFVKAIKE